ncbi:MAG: aminotransferase class V-fold PLP-dependent enzyme [Chloroflexi bacterium]|nr:aminotransferase class V-fold PLP-dependent enzyme [Chloroflexota bacterium]
MAEHGREEASTPWSAWREQTPALREYAYMNSGFSGPSRVAVHRAVRRRLDLELAHGATTRRALDDRHELVERYRETMGRVLGGASPEEIAVTGNTTEGINIIVNGLGLGPGDCVVTTSVEHGSGIVPAYVQRDRNGCELAIVPLEAQDSPDRVAEACVAAMERARGRLGLVILSEIAYSTGQLLPLGAIVREAHRRGGLVLVDGAQTAGHLPIDVRASDVDFYAIPSHKWLCGPEGLGALYVRADLIPRVEPSKVAGRAAASYDLEGSFEAERALITKYELTTTSTALMAGTIEAAEWFLDAGPEAVFERARSLNRYAQGRFERIEGVTVLSPRGDAARTGLFCFAVDGLDAALVNAWLQHEAKVVCRSVAQFNSVRLSLHAFNTRDDIDRAASSVERAIREGIPEDITPAYPPQVVAGGGP